MIPISQRTNKGRPQERTQGRHPQCCTVPCPLCVCKCVTRATNSNFSAHFFRERALSDESHDLLRQRCTSRMLAKRIPHNWRLSRNRSSRLSKPPDCPNTLRTRPQHLNNKHRSSNNTKSSQTYIHGAAIEWCGQEHPDSELSIPETKGPPQTLFNIQKEWGLTVRTSSDAKR